MSILTTGIFTPIKLDSRQSLKQAAKFFAQGAMFALCMALIIFAGLVWSN